MYSYFIVVKKANGFIRYMNFSRQTAFRATQVAPIRSMCGSVLRSAACVRHASTVRRSANLGRTHFFFGFFVFCLFFLASSTLLVLSIFVVTVWLQNLLLFAILLHIHIALCFLPISFYLSISLTSSQKMHLRFTYTLFSTRSTKHHANRK